MLAEGVEETCEETHGECSMGEKKERREGGREGGGGEESGGEGESRGK